MRKTTARLAVLSAAMLLSSGASAQSSSTDKRTQAQALFDEAMTAMDRKAYDEACPKLEAVVDLQPGKLGAMFWLAQCYDAAGKIASAWTRYRAVADNAPPSDSLKKKAQDKVTELEPRLPRLTIAVPASARALAGLDVTRDGIEVAPALWGVKVPIDPGHHVVMAIATGKKPWTGAADAVAGGVPITIELGPLEDASVAAASPPAPPAASPAAVPVPGSGEATPPIEPAAAAPLNRRALGAVVGGVGLVGVVVGAVFGGRAFSKLSESNADNHCHAGNQCDDTGRDLRASSISAGNISTVAFIAGGVVLGAGVVIFATAPAASRTQAKVSFGPRGLELLGTWQ